MAYAHDTHHAAAGLSLADRIGQLRADLAARVARYRLYRQTLAELSALTPRELDDLGLNSTELRDLAWRAASAA